MLTIGLTHKTVGYRCRHGWALIAGAINLVLEEAILETHLIRIAMVMVGAMGMEWFLELYMAMEVWHL